MCCFSYSDAPPLPCEEKSKEEQRCGVAMEVEAEASYSYGFLPPGRNQPYGPPPHHPPVRKIASQDQEVDCTVFFINPRRKQGLYYGLSYSTTADFYCWCYSEEGELWEYFPCPFCYIEVEMPFIRDHLQEEHCFDTRNAVCPICAENLGKDMSAHFRFQHSLLLKRRKPSKPPSSSPWPGAPGKEPYGEVNPYMMSRPRQDPEPDPLLSQFICVGGDRSEPESHDGAGHSSAISDVHRSSQSQRVSQVELEERLQRIEFLREIITSTIL